MKSQVRCNSYLEVIEGNTCTGVHPARVWTYSRRVVRYRWSPWGGHCCPRRRCCCRRRCRVIKRLVHIVVFLIVNVGAVVRGATGAVSVVHLGGGLTLFRRHVWLTLQGQKQGRMSTRSDTRSHFYKVKHKVTCPQGHMSTRLNTRSRVFKVKHKVTCLQGQTQGHMFTRSNTRSYVYKVNHKVTCLQGQTQGPHVHKVTRKITCLRVTHKINWLKSHIAT